MNKCDTGITNQTSKQITQKQDRGESQTSVFSIYVIYSPESPQVSLHRLNCPNMVFMSICINLYQAFLTSRNASDAVGSCIPSSTPTSIFPLSESCPDLKVSRKALSSPGFIVELLHAIFLRTPV